jgi:PRMT5 arginine-N-methyltransferase/ribosomal protein L11 methyltransferase PrmA
VSLIVDEHRQFLSDDVRLAAFQQAISDLVRPGATVLDLASGTGILGLFACRAGARHVYSIEVTGIVELARAVAARNGLADRITFIQALSSEASLPERVDVIVCDQIGHFGFEAGLLTYASDARDRFLASGGAMMPSRLDLIVALVESEELHGQVDFWSRCPAGFNFDPVREWAVNTGYPATLPKAALLGEAAVATSIDMFAVNGGPFRFATRLAVERSGVLHGVGGWFSASLSPRVTLTNSPLAAMRLNRRNVFFPIDCPAAVEAGDIVDVDMHVIPAESIVTWTAHAIRPRENNRTIVRARHSTMQGMLLSRDERRRMDPRFVPSLTPRGAARLSVLALSDGSRSLADIEREVQRRHSDLFPTVRDAGAFVVEVISRYAR